MGWTFPRLIAAGNDWFDDWCDYDGPACYELGTGGPRGGQIEWHYVGETGNERARIVCYARSGSHLSEVIDRHLRQGWHLYYRGFAVDTKTEARRIQDERLRRFDYDWNILLNDSSWRGPHQRI